MCHWTDQAIWGEDGSEVRVVVDPAAAQAGHHAVPRQRHAVTCSTGVQSIGQYQLLFQEKI
jgi:hypothetical protein